jgi:hypothetical protein
MGVTRGISQFLSMQGSVSFHLKGIQALPITGEGYFVDRFEVLAIVFSRGRLAQLVRAPALQAGGHKSESCTAQYKKRFLV